MTEKGEKSVKLKPLMLNPAAIGHGTCPQCGKFFQVCLRLAFFSSSLSSISFFFHLFFHCFVKMGGPIWSDPIVNPSFVSRVLDHFQKSASSPTSSSSSTSSSTSSSSDATPVS